MRSDRWLSIAGVLAVALALPVAAQEAYDGFDYPSGESIVGKAGGTGWSGDWTSVLLGQDVQTVSEGLSFLGLTTTGGSIRVQSNDERDVGRLFGSVGGTGQSVFASFLLRFDEPGGTDSGFLAVAAGAPGFVGGLAMDPDTGPQLRIYDLVTVDHDFASFTPIAGATYMMVGEARIDVGGSARGFVSVWESGASSPSASVSLGLVGDWSGGVSALILGGAGPVTLDEVRVGLTHPLAGPEAVPEAGTHVALAVLACAGGLCFMRSRWRARHVGTTG